ncbi:competence protein ComEC [Aquimarina sp. EL_43]|uniref:ComEC/Rec2 family competence protein n=1 Tax=unclassified Aquimarina TaxID=2627091 RepID=UPI0018C9B37B|nr:MULTISPECIES: ComEC/Rec2 family competence protein [unclassified Aquimarina]MBG6133626.1 competence protein ComEC [Aquimarina sp. EL_35]MBG6152395.1 competence protein ComEC [Aquimarina sp. EL_32]MBG6171999.1 competence protein ComEC [Aquimarina sp. EL_43]
MKLINIPFIVITISTLLGILMGCRLTIVPEIVVLSFSISICILGVSWKRSKRMFSKGHSFVIITVIVFIIFGIALVKIHNPKNYPNHYSNHINLKEQPYDIGIQFYIKERLKPSSYYNKYVASIKLVDGKAVHGKILLQVTKDSTQNVLDIGNTYTTFTALKPIPRALNPYQFDYSKYLHTQYISHKIVVLPHQLIDNHKIEYSLGYLANQIRKTSNLKLSKYNFNSTQLSIINALLLGQRQDISQDVFDNYRDAGAIHILAVSGLHVGIILLLLNLILKPLNRYHKNGKIIKLILTILSLWCFAIIAGLSPSVLRAVTMFSFLAIGIKIRSKTSIYNSLFISLFILICFNPLLLFSVGFQLSYLAVFAIAWIQPLLFKIYRPRFYLSKKLWETFTVTMAAQLGLLPLTLLYFHQFPLLFFMSNLIILPFLGGILGFGILVILLAYLNILPGSIATLFGDCINIMNIIIEWIANQESFVIKNIPFSTSMCIVSYLTIILLVMMFKKYERKKLYGLGVSIITLFSVLIYEKYVISNLEELIVFHNQRNTTLGILENQQFRIYSKDSIAVKTQHFLFGNYLTKNQATLDTVMQLKNIYQYKKQTIMVIDSTSIYAIKSFYPDIIILSNSPKIHLDRVIDSLHPKQIVVDASNYKSYIDQWEISCKKQKIPFHRTDKKGAFILK